MKAESSKIQGFFTIFSLYIAQSIPMSFFVTAIPIMMRENDFSLSSIGLLQLIKLPWILKIFWAPLVDRHTRTLDDYKRWIISSELVYASLIFLLVFFDFNLDFPLVVVLIILAIAASATQDIATDALTTLSFSKQDRGMANGIQSMGGFTGSIIGVGVLILLLDRYGWNNILPFMVVFVLATIIPLFFFRKDLGGRRLLDNTEIVISKKAGMSDLYRFFGQKSSWKQILFLLLFNSGLMGSLFMIKPYMVDLDYSIADIGIIFGLFGSSIAFSFAFFAGVFIKKLGRIMAMKISILFTLFTTISVYLLNYTHPSNLLVILSVALVWSAYGFASVIVYTASMDYVRSGREGTDFTLQSVISNFSSMIIAMLSGSIAEVFGYDGLFVFGIIMAVISTIYVFLRFIGYYRAMQIYEKRNTQ